MQDPQVRLTEEEQRRLAELEAAFHMEDPRLARRLRCAKRIPLMGVVLSTAPPARGVLGSLLAVAGAAIMLVSLTLWLPAAIGGAVLMALGGYLALTAPALQKRLRRLEAWLRQSSKPADHEV